MQPTACSLNSWEAAECPKLGPTFKQIVEKTTKIDRLLTEWVLEPGLREELRVRIADILCEVNEIPPMLGDLGFDYVGTMQDYQEVLEALKVPKLSLNDLISLKDQGPKIDTGRHPAHWSR